MLLPSGTCESLISLPETEEESEDADDRVSRMFASRTAASLELFEASFINRSLSGAAGAGAHGAGAEHLPEASGHWVLNRSIIYIYI